MKTDDRAANDPDIDPVLTAILLYATPLALVPAGGLRGDD